MACVAARERGEPMLKKPDGAIWQGPAFLIEAWNAKLKQWEIAVHDLSGKEPHFWRARADAERALALSEALRARKARVMECWVGP